MDTNMTHSQEKLKDWKEQLRERFHYSEIVPDYDDNNKVTYNELENFIDSILADKIARLEAEKKQAMDTPQGIGETVEVDRHDIQLILKEGFNQGIDLSIRVLKE